MKPADLAWAAGEGAAVRAEAVALLPRLGALATVTRLRATHPDVASERIATACSVAAAAASHADKLGPGAENLLVTDTLAQQATHWAVAAYRAQELRTLGIARIIDASAGAGLDSRALVAAGLEVTAIERDAATFECLRANLPAVRVLHGDSVELVEGLLDQTPQAVFVDPARRDDGPRRTDGGRAHPERDPERWSPPWSWVQTLSLRAPVIAKVAPGIPLARLDEASTEWIGVGNDLVEACAWMGDLRRGFRRKATVVVPQIGVESIDDSETCAARVEPIGEWLLEPHEAVKRAGLVDHLAAQMDAGRVSEASTWLTTATPAHTSLARLWRVESVVPIADLRAATRRYATVSFKTSDVDRAAESVAASVRHKASRDARGAGFVVLMRGLDVAAIVQPAETRHRSL